jgi:hypothetical protein
MLMVVILPVCVLCQVSILVQHPNPQTGKITTINMATWYNIQTGKITTINMLTWHNTQTGKITTINMHVNGSYFTCLYVVPS